MDDITTRTIVIAVNIFVTLTIVSLVLIMFFQMKDIYGVVSTTDTSIYNKFDDVFSMYHGKITTSIGLLNAIKKYEDENPSNVVIRYSNSDDLREKSQQINMREALYLKDCMQEKKFCTDRKFNYSLEDKYTVQVLEEGNNLVIEFSKIEE